MKHEFDNFEDFFSDDDILNKKQKKKKINVKDKGGRSELALTKILNERFGTGFSRSVGSGNRWSQAHLPKHASDVFSGDTVCPENFKFCIECKGGYSSIDFNSVFPDGNKDIDKFLSQASKDGERCNRKPLLCWRRDRRPWIVFVLIEDFQDYIYQEYYLKYNKWVALKLDDFLKLDDAFFFNN